MAGNAGRGLGCEAGQASDPVPGFTREKVIDALHKHAGNADTAYEYLNFDPRVTSLQLKDPSHDVSRSHVVHCSHVLTQGHRFVVSNP